MPLDIWTVYDHPKDFPNCFVARRFEGETATSDIMTEDNLVVLRRRLADMGLMPLVRNDGDDPIIIETWL